MPPAESATALHLARARQVGHAARVDGLIGLTVALAGFGEMLTALLWGRGHDLLGWLLRVRVLGLMGLLVSVWGWALLDQAWHRLGTARAAQRAIITGGPGWAAGLARLDTPDDRRA